MIITHTVNHEGKHRIYLGAASSLQAWLEQKDDTPQWEFAFDASDASRNLNQEDLHQWASGLLYDLARQLRVQPCELKSVPFQTIAGLHSPVPTHNRRIPSPQRETIETGYMPTPPGVTRTKADFTASNFTAYHAKGRSKGRK